MAPTKPTDSKKAALTARLAAARAAKKPAKGKQAMVIKKAATPKKSAAPVPAPTPSPAPPISSHRARQARPARGELRGTPCLACVNSALAGKSDGGCYDTVGIGKRCHRCSSGHKCVEIESSEARKLARRLVSALQAGERGSKVKHLRSALRLALESGADNEEEEEEDDDEAGGAPSTPARASLDAAVSPEITAKRKRVIELLGELVELLIN